MSPSERQGRFIIARGWLSREVVSKAFGQARFAGLELCEFLFREGMITREQVEQTRALADDAAALASSGELLRRSASDMADTRVEAGLGSTQVLDQDFGRRLLRLSQSQELVAGQRFLHYELGDEISRGAMGVVVRAVDTEHDRAVALKFMRVGLERSVDIERFQREAETLICLKHSNIVEIFDFGRSGGRLFYAMEEIVGRDLKSIIDEGARFGTLGRDWREHASLLRDVASALRYCHEQSVWHRDVKPQNVVVEEPCGRPVLLDFGLMKQSHDQSAEDALTRTGEIIGTPAFMSPEQFTPGKAYGEVGPATDVWGFGALLYFCLCGRPPFDAPSMLEIYRLMNASEAPRLSVVESSLPAWLDELCAACLRKQPDERLTMTEVVSALEEGLGFSDEAAPREAPKRRATASFMVLVALAVAALIASQPWGRGVRLASVELASSGSVVASEDVTVRGRFEGAGGEVRLGREDRRGGVQETLAERRFGELSAGDFELRAPLVEGLNFLVLSLFEDGQLKERRSFEVTADRSPPVVNLALDRFVGPGPPALVAEATPEGKWRVHGSVRDVHEAEFELQGQAVPLSDEGEFSVTFDAAERQPFEVKGQARDRLGNRCPVELLIVGPQAAVVAKARAEFRKQEEASRRAADTHRAAVEAEFGSYAEACSWDPATISDLSPLRDVLSWAQATPREQDRALMVVAGRLGGDFVMLAPRYYRCGRLEQRIGSFRHVDSGLDFRVIPGWFGSVKVWREPQRRIALAALDFGSFAALNAPESLWSLFYTIPFEGFREKLREKLGLAPLTKIKGEGWQRRLDRDAEELGIYFADTQRGPERRSRLWSFCEKYRISVLGDGELGQQEFYLPPLLLASHELERGVWESHGGKEGSDPLDEEDLDPDLPIVGVDLEDARSWLEGLGSGLRLPTSREWQHAARGGVSGASSFWWSGYAVDHACRPPGGFDAYAEELQPAVRLDAKPNVFGLYELFGNASEWCEGEEQHWMRVWGDTLEEDDGEEDGDEEDDGEEDGDEEDDDEEDDDEEDDDEGPRWPGRRYGILLGGSVWWPAGRCRPDQVTRQRRWSAWGPWSFRLARSIE